MGKTPEEHATAILVWLRAMLDAGSTLTDASDIVRLAPPIAAHIREYGEAQAAVQKERTIEAVTSVANSMDTDASEAFYLGYELAIRNALAAIRAETPPLPPE